MSPSVGKADTSAVTESISEAVSGKADTSAVTEAIDAAVSGKADTSAVTENYYNKEDINYMLEDKASTWDLYWVEQTANNADSKATEALERLDSNILTPQKLDEGAEMPSEISIQKGINSSIEIVAGVQRYQPFFWEIFQNALVQAVLETKFAGSENWFPQGTDIDEGFNNKDLMYVLAWRQSDDTPYITFHCDDWNASLSLSAGTIQASGSTILTNEESYPWSCNLSYVGEGNNFTVSGSFECEGLKTFNDFIEQSIIPYTDYNADAVCFKLGGGFIWPWYTKSKSYHTDVLGTASDYIKAGNIYGEGKFAFGSSSAYYVQTIIDGSNYVNFQNLKPSVGSFDFHEVIGIFDVNHFDYNLAKELSFDYHFGTSVYSNDELNVTLCDGLMYKCVSDVSGNVQTHNTDKFNITLELKSHESDYDLYHVVIALKESVYSQSGNYIKEFSPWNSVYDMNAVLLYVNPNINDYYTKDETDGLITEATSGKADTSAVTQDIAAAVSGKVDTSAITSSVTSASTDSEIPTAKAVYDAVEAGGGATYTAGRGIDIDSADTISFNLPISADNENFLFAGSGNTYSDAAEKIVIGKGNDIKGNGSNRVFQQGLAIGWHNSITNGTISDINRRKTCVIGYDNKVNGHHTNVIGDSNIIQNSIFNRNYCNIFGYNNKINGGDLTYVTIVGNDNTANGGYCNLFGRYLTTSTSGETYIGQFNSSVNDGTSSGSTIFGIGNGTYNGSRHNAFEVRQNGDIYITSGGTDILLQDNLGGGTVDSTLTSGSTNAVQSSAIWNQFGGLKLQQITQADYDDLVSGGTVDSSTLYIIV